MKELDRIYMHIRFYCRKMNFNTSAIYCELHYSLSLLSSLLPAAAAEATSTTCSQSFRAIPPLFDGSHLVSHYLHRGVMDCIVMSYKYSAICDSVAHTAVGSHLLLKVFITLYYTTTSTVFIYELYFVPPSHCSSLCVTESLSAVEL